MVKFTIVIITICNRLQRANIQNKNFCGQFIMFFENIIPIIILCKSPIAKIYIVRGVHSLWCAYRGVWRVNVQFHVHVHIGGVGGSWICKCTQNVHIKSPIFDDL